MELTNKQKIGIAVTYTVVCVAVGYYLTPEKTKIVREEVKVEDKNVAKRENTDTDVKKDTNTRKTIVEEILPDGTKRKTTVIDSDSQIDKTTKKNSDTTEKTVTKDITKETETVTRGSSSSLSINAMSGVDITSPKGIIYGGSVQKGLLGPVTIGLWGLSNGTAGCTVGLQF